MYNIIETIGINKWKNLYHWQFPIPKLEANVDIIQIRDHESFIVFLKNVGPHQYAKPKEKKFRQPLGTYSGQYSSLDQAC